MFDSDPPTSSPPEDPAPENPAPENPAVFVTTLAALAARAAVACRFDVGGLAAADVAAALSAVDAVVQRMTGLKLALITAQRESEAWKGRGDPSYESFRGRTTRAGDRAARAETRLADAVRTVPAAGEALIAGEITAEHVAVLARVTNGQPDRSQRVAKALQSGGDRHLLSMARRMNARDFGRAAAQWAARLDADAVEDGFQRTRARRYLRVHDAAGGVRIDGFLDPVAGHTVKLALEAATPRPAADDERTSDQRRADALVDVATRSLDDGAAKADALLRPHLSVLVREETWTALRRRRLQAPEPGQAAATKAPATPDVHAPTTKPPNAAPTVGRPRTGPPAKAPPAPATAPFAPGLPAPPTAPPAPGLPAPPTAPPAPGPPAIAPAATTEDGIIVPLSALERLACDCELTRVVLGAQSELLDVGRAQRSFSRQMRRGIIARDRHCRWPECSRPARWSEVHHIVHWSQHGATSAENGIVLCSYHHHEVHRRAVTIESVAGGHCFRAGDGREIGLSLRELDRPPGEPPPGTTLEGRSPRTPPIVPAPAHSPAP